MKQALIISTLLHLALLTGGWSVPDHPPHPSGQALTLTLLSPPAHAGQSGSAPQARDDEPTPVTKKPQRQIASKHRRKETDDHQPNRNSATPDTQARDKQRRSTTPSPAPHAPAEAHARPASPQEVARSEQGQTSNTAAGGTVSGSQLRAALQTALAPHFHYPSLARRRGWQGTVELTVHIAADGRLNSIRIIHGSGHAILDKAARHALQQVTHVPTARDRLPGGGLEMILPVEYRLVDS